jgi:hypothetical protein
VGGFGTYSKIFGTAAASLLEAEVVTADGRVRLANNCTNDQLWALKGGGGGSFGVVTRLTLHTHGTQLRRPRGANHSGLRRGNKLGINLEFQGINEEKAIAILQALLNWIAAAGGLLTNPPLIRSIPARHRWDPVFLKADAQTAILTDDRPGAPADNVFWSTNLS